MPPDWSITAPFRQGYQGQILSALRRHARLSVVLDGMPDPIATPASRWWTTLISSVEAHNAVDDFLRMLRDLPAATTVLDAEKLVRIRAETSSADAAFAGRFLPLSIVGSSRRTWLLAAADLSTGREVSIRLSHMAAARRYDALRDEQRVFHMLADDQGVPPILSVGEAEGRSYLVLDGAARVGRRLRPTRTWPTLMSAILPLVETIALLHFHDMPHCDISPENIIFGRGLRPRLVDFDGTLHSAAMGGLLNTRYSAPEVRAGSQPTVVSDVYSLGLFILLRITGSEFAQGGTAQHIESRLREFQLHGDRTGAVRALLARETARIVSGMVSLNPTDRPASANEVLLRLRRVQNIVNAATADEPARVQIELELDGEIEGLSGVDAIGIQSVLAELTGDHSLKIATLRRGSIILTLDASPEAARLLMELIKRGDLRDLYGIPIVAARAEDEPRASASKGSSPKKRAKRQGNPNLEWDFFLAYASPDQNHAQLLFEALVARARVFLDVRCLAPGDDWGSTIRKAQTSSKVTVVLVSDRVDEAYYQREEIAGAIELSRRKDRHRVVPVYLGASTGIDEVPYGLRLKQGLWLCEHGDMMGIANRLLSLIS